MSWIEMEKKAQNHVVLRDNVDVLQGIKGKEERRKKKQFLHKGKKNVFCVPVLHVVFEYLNIIA